MNEFLDGDFTGDLWNRLKANYEARLQELRIKLEKKMDAEETARVRGQIFEVKQFLALPRSKATPSEPIDA